MSKKQLEFSYRPPRLHKAALYWDVVVVEKYLMQFIYSEALFLPSFSNLKRKINIYTRDRLLIYS